MAELICYDLHGAPLTHFTQWDTGRVVKLMGIDTSTGIELYVGNRNIGNPIVANKQIDGNTVTFEIPDSVLHTPEPVVIYLKATSVNETITTGIARIPVYPAAKPLSYSYNDVPVLRSTGYITVSNKHSVSVSCGFMPDLVVLSGLSYDGVQETLTVPFRESGKDVDTAMCRDTRYPTLLGTFSKSDDGFMVIITAFDANWDEISEAEIILEYTAVKYTA